MPEVNNEDKEVKKIENPKGTITLNEALLMLKEKSNIEKTGIRIAAVRDGFKSAHVGQGKESFLLNAVKFQKWIKNKIDIEKNYKQIAVIAKELNITTSYIYNIIKTHKIKTKKAGGGIGKKYIDFVTFKNVFNTIKRRKKG